MLEKNCPVWSVILLAPFGRKTYDLEKRPDWLDLCDVADVGFDARGEGFGEIT
jgi:hypothetical protein